MQGRELRRGGVWYARRNVLSVRRPGTICRGEKVKEKSIWHVERDLSWLQRV